ncbi:MAG: hypothetical protein Q7J34_05185 [Bacteroidales bacterium]|nr:hypothetical protein [Bacteroidales bacterium]
MIKLMILSIALLSVALIFIGIKMFVQKDGQFSKSCASIDTEDGQRSDCVCSGGGDDSNCEYYSKHHP